MPETTTNNPPTEKMLGYAERIANAFGTELPSDASLDFEACKTFIDQYADKPFPPSQKQLAFAEKIAEQNGLEIDEETRSEAKLLSAWIDDNK